MFNKDIEPDNIEESATLRDELTHLRLAWRDYILQILPKKSKQKPITLKVSSLDFAHERDPVGKALSSNPNKQSQPEQKS